MLPKVRRRRYAVRGRGIAVTPELRAARLGKLTSSEAGTLMGGENTDGLAKIVKRAAFERVYGDHGEEGYQSWAMKRGNVVEAEALDAYELNQLCVLDRGRHVDHPTIPWVAATPDGVRSDYGLDGLTIAVEAKSLTHAAWLEVLKKQQVPAEYRWQCRWQAWNLAAPFTHFWAYHPQAHGILIPFEVTAEDCAQMRERVILVEARIAEWIEIIRSNKPR